MKILVSLFILSFPFSVFGDVYYCVVEKNTGFSWEDNYKNQTVFKNDRYVVDIDFNKNELKSEDLKINTDFGHVCLSDPRYDEMQCINGWSASFTISKINLNFIYSTGLGYIIEDISNNDIGLFYGKCQKF